MVASADIARPASRSDFGPPVPLYLVSFLVLGIAINFLGPALTELRDRSGSGIGSIGRLFAAQSVGYFAGSQVAGRLVDRIDGHRVFAGGLLTIGTGMVLIPEMSTVGGWLPVFVVLGLGTAAVDVGANLMLLWALGPRSGRPMNTLHLMFGVGALIAPLIVYADIAWAARASAVATVALAAWALVTPSPARPTQARAEHTTATRPLLLTVAVFFLVYVGLEAGFGGWLKTYAEEYRMSDFAATWLVTTFWIAFTAGRALASAAGERIQPRLVMFTAALGALAAGVVLTAGRGSAAAVWAGTVLLGVAAAPQFPVMFNYLERRIPVTGGVTAWLIGGTAIGGLVFPLLMGAAIDANGPGALAVFALVLAAAALLAFAAVDRQFGR